MSVTSKRSAVLLGLLALCLLPGTAFGKLGGKVNSPSFGIGGGQSCYVQAIMVPEPQSIYHRIESRIYCTAATGVLAARVDLDRWDPAAKKWVNVSYATAVSSGFASYLSANKTGGSLPKCSGGKLITYKVTATGAWQIFSYQQAVMSGTYASC